jgi:hypothetical protein
MPFENPEYFIGKSASDQPLKKFILSLNETSKVDHFAEMEMFEYPKNGTTIYFDKADHVIAMFFYGIADKDHAHYAGRLPLGISFHDGKAVVLNKLGSPSASGTEKSTRRFWVRFDFEWYSLHIQFALDLASVSMVTLMSPGLANGEI